MSFPPNAVIKGDLPCQRCGYNLRTLAVSKRCPECGDPVLPSIGAFREKLVVFHRPMMAILGLDMLALMFLMDTRYRVLVSSWLDAHPDDANAFRCGTLLAGGMFLLAWSDTKRFRAWKGLWARLPLAAAGMAFGARLMLGFFVWVGVVPDRVEDILHWLCVQTTFPQSLQIAAMTALLVFALRTARGLRSRQAFLGAAALLLPLAWPTFVASYVASWHFGGRSAISHWLEHAADMSARLHWLMVVPALYCLSLGLIIAGRRKESEALVEVGVPLAVPAEDGSAITEPLVSPK